MYPFNGNEIVVWKCRSQYTTSFYLRELTPKVQQMEFLSRLEHINQKFKTDIALDLVCLFVGCITIGLGIFDLRSHQCDVGNALRINKPLGIFIVSMVLIALHTVLKTVIFIHKRNHLVALQHKFQ